MIFEWDPAKASANLQKHGVAFTEGASVFLDPLALTFPDPDHSEGEARFVTLGHSSTGNLLFVSHLDLEANRIRIISTRRATRRESHDYRERR